MFKQIAALFGLALFAVSVSANEADIKRIQEHFKSFYPEIKITSIKASPVTNLYEVQANQGILYVTGDAKYALNGHLLDLGEDGQDLTEVSLQNIRLDMLKKIDSSLLTFAAKEPKHEVVVFTDVDCGYCRKFHTSVPELNEKGITIKYAGFPRAGLGSSSFQTLVSIWCSEDQQGAMTAAKAGQQFEAKSCDHPINEHMKTVMELGLRGTPALIFEDGSMIPGYLTVEQMMQAVEQVASKQSS